MIFQFLINIVFDIINAVISVLPDPDELPGGISSAFNTIATYFHKANAILPVDTMFTIIGLILSVEAGVLLFKLSNWVINKVRGSG